MSGFMLHWAKIVINKNKRTNFLSMESLSPAKSDYIFIGRYIFIFMHVGKCRWIFSWTLLRLIHQHPYYTRFNVQYVQRKGFYLTCSACFSFHSEFCSLAMYRVQRVQMHHFCLFSSVVFALVLRWGLNTMIHRFNFRLSIFHRWDR